MRRLAAVLLFTFPLFAQLPAGVSRFAFPGDSPPEPRLLVASSEGALWAAMGVDSVIYRFDVDAPARRINLPAWGIYDMTVGPDEALWVATEKYVGRLDPATNLVRPWFEHKNVRHILSGSDGNIWFVQGVAEKYRIWHPRLVRFSPEGVVLATYRILAPYRQGGVAGAVFGSDGALWLSTSDGDTPRLVRMTTAGERAEYSIEKASPLFAGPGFLWTVFADHIVRLNLQGAIIGTYRVSMTPVGVDAIGNLWLRARTDAGEEVAQITPSGVLTRFAPLPSLPSDECTLPEHGGFAVLPNGRVAMTDYHPDFGYRDWDPCLKSPIVLENALTILDPAVAPILSIEQLNTVPRRRTARR